jgi:medium-chain acyl-[acyl-carrier-protein] hydrolase
VTERQRLDARAWLLVQPARVAPRFKLVCLPYAGGGTTLFHGWGAALPAAVEVQAVRLPGRGPRLREPAVTQMSALVDALVDVLEPELGGRYGLFGHSMGGRVAFEVTRELDRRRLPQPAQLWISGSRAPQLRPRRAPIHELPEPEFIAELQRYGGAPPEVLANRELMEIYIPVLRSDFALHDTYTHRPGPPLAVPLSVFGGTDDPYVPAGDLEPWSAHTTAGFDLQMFPGGHFFLHGAKTLLLDRLAKDLTTWLERTTPTR